MSTFSLWFWRITAALGRFVYDNRKEPAMWFFGLVVVEAALLAALWLLTKLL